MKTQIAMVALLVIGSLLVMPNVSAIKQSVSNVDNRTCIPTYPIDLVCGILYDYLCGTYTILGRHIVVDIGCIFKPPMN